ncbi:MAG: hypothetical protein IPO17_02660 [Flavobacteriales bacterium]|nr:hypothetical protein [Flavobacteriales bacterium]
MPGYDRSLSAADRCGVGVHRFPETLNRTMFPAVCAQVLGILPSCTGEGGHCAAKCRKPAPDHQWFPRIHLLFSKKQQMVFKKQQMVFENNKCFLRTTDGFGGCCCFSKHKLFQKQQIVSGKQQMVFREQQMVFRKQQMVLADPFVVFQEQQLVV